MIDGEYTNIINNLNLMEIKPEAEIMSLFKEILQAIGDMRLNYKMGQAVTNADLREKRRRLYEKMVE